MKLVSRLLLTVLLLVISACSESDQLKVVSFQKNEQFHKSKSGSLYNRDTTSSLEKMKQFMQRYPKIDMRLKDLYYEVHGDAQNDTLVLVHGLDGSHRSFNTILNALATKYRVLIYDQRGHGNSKYRGLHFFNEDMADDLKKILDHLSIKKVHLLGQSLGGRTVVKFAERYPQMTKSVVIEDMEFISRHNAKDLSDKVFEDTLNHSAMFQARFEKNSFPNIKSAIEPLEMLYGKKIAKLIAKDVIIEGKDGRFHLSFYPWFSILYGFMGTIEDMTASLKSIQVPMLVFRADHGKGGGISSRGYLHLQKFAPNAEILYLKESGHLIHRSYPKKFLKHLFTFLSKVEK